MKIQVITSEPEAISGFDHILIQNGQCPDIDNVINHSCTELIAIDCLDKLSYDDSVKFFGELIKKIRLGGTLVLRGIGLLSIGQQIISEAIDAQSLSNIISNIKCLHDPRNIVNVLEKENFTVTMYLRGIHYEITATRQRA